MNTTVKACLVALLGGLICSGAMAQPMRVEEVPESLRAWVPWVLHGNTTAGCVRHGDDFLCDWTTELSLTMNERTGSFALTALADNQTDIMLPGTGASFPQHVRVDGRPAVVLTESGVPFVAVTRGTHRIEGDFSWTERPETLAVPRSIGLVRLSLDGRVVESVRRDEAGSVWLARRETEVTEADRTSVEVHRRIADGNPIRVETRIALQIGGRAREIALGSVLLEGSLPVQATSSIPMRLSAEGVLTVQAAAGSHEITIESILDNGALTLKAPAQNDPWPAQETWAFERNETLRQTEIAGGNAIDPARTNLPSEWRALPAYQLERGAQLTLSVSRRGDPEPRPNRLTLQRNIWIDLDGKGLTARDQIRGEMHRDWRLNFLVGTLGRASLEGTDQTISRAEHGAGVEVRSSNVVLDADWRRDGDVGTLPTVGWSQDVQSASTMLHLPPGWRLLATTGVDQAPGAWIKQWSLWGLFFVLIVAILFGRTYGIAAGAVTLVTVTLLYHEDNAPLVQWIALALSFALARAFSQKFLKQIMMIVWSLSLLALVVQGTLFSVDRMRFAIHPASDPNASGTFNGDLMTARSVSSQTMDAEEAFAPPMPGVAAPAPTGGMAMEDAVANSAVMHRQGLAEGGRGETNSRGGYDSLQKARETLQAQDPNAIVQTGPGVPNWSWTTINLSWPAAVRHDETFSVVLLPPAATRLLAVLEVALVMLLAWIVWRARPQWASGDDKESSSKLTTPAVTVAALLFLAAFAAPVAHAQEAPSQEILNTLRDRLLEAPLCGEECVQVTGLTIEAHGDAFALELEAHAEVLTSLLLPGPVDSWLPSRVSIDGLSGPGLLRVDGENFLRVRLPAGVHRVRLEGSLAGRDTLSFTLPVVPPRAQVNVEGWSVDGVEDDVPSETLSLQRIERTPTADGVSAVASEGPVLPSWIVLERTLRLGVVWSVESQVRRLGASTAPISIRIPRLATEAVTSTDVISDHDEIVVSLGAGESEKSWTSRLEISPEITLSAARNVPRSETWRVECGSTWHCSYEGAPVISHEGAGVVLPVFEPWPGESIKVGVVRPEAIAGQTRTLDGASLEVTFGTRIVQSKLDLQVRASAGGPLAITLPEGADVRSLSVDNTPRPVQRVGQRVIVSVAPGASHICLEWQSPFEWSINALSPSVSIDSRAVNVNVTLHMPADRWLLWTSGPSWGPRVHFWGYLALIVLAALGLSRIRETSMSTLDWILLGLGLAHIPALASIAIVGWFLLLANRRTKVDIDANAFNLRQLFLVPYTLVALGCLLEAVRSGLLVDPDMIVLGAPDPHTLSFYTDRIASVMPTAQAVTLPMWAYRTVMLLWSLWLAMRVVRWATHAWQAFFVGGAWKMMAPLPPRPVAAPVKPVQQDVTEPVAIVAPDEAPKDEPPSSL